MTASTPDPQGQARRRLMKALVAAGGAFATATVLPTRWTRPVVDSLMIPLHAQTSPVQLIVGPFASSSDVTGSFLDFFVQPLNAAPARSIEVGNGRFDVAWTLMESGYAVCGEGEVTTSNSVVQVVIDGSGCRTENILDDYSQSITGGTFQLIKQSVSSGGLSYAVLFQADSTNGVAGPGSSCALNVVQRLQMSSPYPDERLG